MIEAFDSQPGRETPPGQDRRERTLIVVCEFTGKKYRQRLTPSARQAKGAVRAIREQGEPEEGDSRDLQTDAMEELIAEPSSSQISDEAAECRELAISAGANVLDVIVQRRDHPDPATLVGKGKLEEITGQAKASRADLIIFEQNLSPSQLRELEHASAVPCDRSHATDSGYFCLPRSDSGRAITGGVGAAGIYASAAGWTRPFDVPAGRRNRDPRAR